MIESIKHSFSYIASYERLAISSEIKPTDYHKFNILIALISQFAQTYQNLVDQCIYTFANISIQNHECLEELMQVGAEWKILESNFQKLNLSTSEIRSIIQLSIYKYEHEGCTIPISIAIFLSTYLLSLDKANYTYFIWLKRSIFCCICYFFPSIIFINYTESLFKKTIYFFPEINGIFHYRKLAAFYKNFGFQASKLPKLLSLLHIEISKTLEDAFQYDVEIVVGIESRQFAFMMMELCAVLPIKPNKRYFEDQKNITFLIDNDYSANSTLMQNFCDSFNFKYLSSNGVHEKLKNKSSKLLILDQYSLPALYNYLSDKFDKKILLSHSLITRLNQAILTKSGQSIDMTKCITQLTKEGQDVQKDFFSYKLIILCFKDNFRSHHSSDLFMHQRKNSLCPPDYINSIISKLKIAYPTSILLSVNDYDYSFLDYEIKSYQEFSDDKNIARIRLLELVSNHPDVLAIGDANGSFDVHSVISRIAIRLGPENCYILSLPCFKEERQSLSVKDIKSLSYELFTRLSKPLSTFGSQKNIIISGIHSKVIEFSSNTVPLQDFAQNTSLLINTIKH